MSFIRCCLLFPFVIFTLQQIVASQYLIDEVLLRGVEVPVMKRLATSVYKFTTDLYAVIEKSEGDSNVFFSPISVYVALAMIYEGSNAITKKQLEAVIRTQDFYSDGDLRDTIKNLLDRLTSPNKNYTLKIANRLFSQMGTQVNDAYQKRIREYFHSGVESMDFRKDPARSRNEINSWVEMTTLGKIKNFFPDHAITSDTVLLLANAVYFNAAWLYKFLKELTEPRTFTAPQNKKLEVLMMHRVQSGLFYASKDKTYRLLELPYGDKNLSMIVAVEDKTDGFKDLLTAKLTSYDASVQAFSDRDIDLSLPKFNLQKTMDLKRILQALGLKKLFGSGNLGGIVGSSPLLLSEMYHKSFLNVDESGTEAARATGFEAAMSKSGCGEEEIIEFIVDRPFLFLVVEKATGCILFFGQIKNPLLSN